MVVVNTNELDRKPSGPSHCFYCGLLLNKAKTYDHVDPKSRAGMGANIPNNLVVACKLCNSSKGSMTFEQFRKLKLLEFLLRFWRKGVQIRVKRFQFYGEAHPEQCRFQFRGYNNAEKGKQPEKLLSAAAVAGA